MAMSALSTPSLALSTRLGAPRRGRRVVGVVCQQSPENKSQLAQGKGHGRRLEASAAGSSGDAVSIDGADFARMAAAVKLAAAVSPALSHRAKRFPPRRAAPRDPSTKSAKDASSDVFGPSHARMIEALGPKPGRDLSRTTTARAAYPGGWWGEGTYTDSLAQSDEGFGFKQKRVTRRSSSTARTVVAAAAAAAPDGAGAGGDDADDDAGGDDGGGSTVKSVISIIWAQTIKPLRDFGFGRTNVWEGGVGLFILGGISLTALTIQWILGLNFNKLRSYQAFVEFPFACGIQVGTTVRVRGVKVGNVLSVRPSLEKVEVLIEMDDDGIVIPRNSLVEANQSGLIAETIIDITPELPIPKAQWGPLDSGCEGEGLVVCDRGKIQGVPGVSMDDLVGICTKLAREMDQQKGLQKMFAATTAAEDLMKNLEPLLLEAAKIAKDLRPMLQNVQEQGTLDTIELLAGHATKAVTDIRELKQTILTDENQEALRQSITIMTKTLQHMEKVSGDISSVSGDPATRQNLRHLIQCLSRLVDK